MITVAAISAFDAEQWAKILRPSPVEVAFRDTWQTPDQQLMSSATAATDQRVPELPWLLAAVILLAVVLGPVNMLVLKRLHRRELAWITIPAISLLALAGFWVALRSGSRPTRDGALPLLAGGLLILPLMAKAGAWWNYLLPAHCAAVVLASSAAPTPSRLNRALSWAPLVLIGCALTITGERERVGEQSEERFYRFERRFGRFSRTVGVPQGVTEDGVSAEYRDGVLEVHVRKPEQPKPKRIQVGSGVGATIEGKSEQK